MGARSDFETLRQRWADFASRFNERKTGDEGRRACGTGPATLRSVLWTLRDLFISGFSSEALRDLFQRDPEDTYRFFTKEIDFASLRGLPWYRRYPDVLWKIFAALAYRLSPPRRILFAIATVAFVLGAVQFLVWRPDQPGIRWWLLSLAILFLLLLMELRDKLDLKGDLEIAREIQFALVPNKPFRSGAISIDCFMRPANTVGGDYYDVIEFGDSKRIAIVMADVAGKGMPAALLMALLQGGLRTLIAAGFRGCELIAKLNHYLCANIPSNRLVTLFYGELDVETGVLEYVNAGHNAPILIQDSEVSRLDSTALVLGVLEETIFVSTRIDLDAGDRLVLFTDGLSEAFNNQGQEYGEPRLVDYVGKGFRLPPAELIQGAVKEVLAFCGDLRPHDDMTLMCVDRAGAQR